MAKVEKKDEESLSSMDDAELSRMQKRATARAGGVAGDAMPVAVAEAAKGAASVPAHLQRTMGKKIKGRTLCLVKMLDGEQLQLYAEASTTGTTILDQVCAMLQAYEKYHYGFTFVDRKGAEEWIKMDKKIIKHEFPKKADHIELELRVRFYPIDVTQVLQYVTLNQCFLEARRSVVNQELLVSARDSMLLAALSLQATKGDYDPKVYPKDSIDASAVIPERTRAAYQLPPGQNLEEFWISEVVRVWSSVKGILKHLAVLK